MITDSFFQQGVTHDVCEDYAIHGKKFAIIADGCSMGGKHIGTDWGARLLCKSAQQCLPLMLIEGQPERPVINYHQMAMDFFLETGKVAKEQLEIISNLIPECLTSTLGVIFQDLGKVSAYLMGDGTIGARRRDGRWEIKTYRPARGAAFYLKYLVHNEVDAWFEQFKPGTYFSDTYFGDLYKPEEMELKTDEYDLEANRLYECATFPLEDYDLVFVASDGASSFYKNVVTSTSKHNEAISLLAALGVIFYEIEPSPNCLQLQRQWAWKQNRTGTFLHKGWHNGDDVAVGIIYNP